MRKVALALVAAVAAFAVAATATAGTFTYQATYVEPVGGPNQLPFSCRAGTSCGTIPRRPARVRPRPRAAHTRSYALSTDAG
jgi:hypothetical protein